jgi:CMP-N-acetylneuraminic acid synthetase
VLEYTLEHVRESRHVTRCILSSDDAQILEVGRAAGLEVLERPTALATATSATDPVLRHAVRALYPAWRAEPSTTESNQGSETTALSDVLNSVVSSVNAVPSALSNRIPEAVVMLYGNVPVRKNWMIDRCIEMLLETGCDSVQTIAPVGKFHPYWMFDREEDGRIAKHVPNNVFRRQELPPLFSPTGAVYVMRTEVLMAAEGSADPHAFLGADRRGCGRR